MSCNEGEWQKGILNRKKMWEKELCVGGERVLSKNPKIHFSIHQYVTGKSMEFSLKKFLNFFFLEICFCCSLSYLHLVFRGPSKIPAVWGLQITVVNFKNRPVKKTKYFGEQSWTFNIFLSRETKTHIIQ